MVQLLKDRDTVKNLKAARENSISHTRNNNMITVEISSRNIESWVAMDHIFKALEEKKVNQEFYIQQNSPSKVKVN